MDLQPVIDFLLKLGITPLELLTIVAVVVLYRDNRMLLDRLTAAEKSIEECVKKVPAASGKNQH